MNAFTPKATVLILLAQHLNELKERGHTYMSIFNNSEVMEWYARMAELEYVPMLPTMLAGFEDGEAHASFNIGAPTPEIVADAVSPSDYVQRQLEKKMIEPPKPAIPLVGYTLTAKHPEEGVLATYAEARTIEDAFERALEEFPLAEGHTEHVVKNTETCEETPLPHLGSQFWRLPQLGQKGTADVRDAARRQDQSALMLDEDVVDTTPSALSLDDD